MADSPTQLGYAPPAAWHRRRRTRRVLLIVALLGAVLASTRWLSAGWRHARLLYWQRMCLDYTVSSDQIPDSRGPATIKAWREFYQLFSPPGRKAAPVIFLHEMRREGWPPRLVAIEVADQQWTHGEGTQTITVFDCHVIDPAGLWSGPRLLSNSSWNRGPHYFAGRGGYLKVRHAQLDPADISHLTIRYERSVKGEPAESGIIDGWLQVEDALLFEVREPVAKTRP
jgi:hypothetical protein